MRIARMLTIACLCAGIAPPGLARAASWCTAARPPIADVPAPDVPFALWTVHIPAGGGVDVYLLNQEGNARHAYGFFTKTGADPWRVINGGEGSGVPGPTTLYVHTSVAQQSVTLLGDPGFENGIGILFNPFATDTDLSVLLLLSAQVPLGGGHTLLCGTPGVSISSVVTGPALHAHARDFSGNGAAAGVDYPFGLSVADGVTYEARVSTSLTGFYWDRPISDGGDTFTSPQGSGPGAGERTFIGAPAGDYSWTLNRHIGGGSDFLFLGADVAL